MKNQDQRSRLHISLYVSDIDRTVKFYSKLFKSGPVKVKAGYAKFLPDNPSLNISFIENPSGIRAEFGHLGIEVQDSAMVNEYAKYLKEQGFNLTEEPGVHCCYAVQDKFWVSDPDGYDWEVYHLLEDSEKSGWKVLSDEEAQACCVAKAEAGEPCC